jgi:hypothetical protein
VRETDTILAYIGVHHPGWVRREFLPFQEDLASDGYELESSLLVRSITAIGVRRTRIKDVPKKWWSSSTDFPASWKRTRAAVTHVAKILSQHFGVYTIEIIPAKNALIPLFALYDKFPDKFFKPDQAMHWLLLASREGRFGGSSSTVLDEDLKVIEKARSFTAAYKALIGNLERDEDLVQERDLQERYTHPFLRLLYYLLIYQNEAKDWMTQIRIGYDKSDKMINKGFQPEWHHVFPRAYLRKYAKGISTEEINTFVNIVVLAQKANQTISSSAPKDYIRELSITNEILGQQYGPANPLYRTAPHFRSFIRWRTKKLAGDMTNFLQSLRK